MGRSFDRELECGCLVSTDGGGGLISCHYGYGCGKEGCDERHRCDDCLKQEKKCKETWDKWMGTKDYQEHIQEIKERNR